MFANLPSISNRSIIYQILQTGSAPVFIIIEMNISAARGQEGMGQLAARPVKGVPVAMVARGEQNLNDGRRIVFLGKCKWCYSGP